MIINNKLVYKIIDKNDKIKTMPLYFLSKERGKVVITD